MPEVLIRRLAEGDADAIAGVFFESVRYGACSDYDDAQRNAWAPAPPEDNSRRDRLKGQHGFVAEQDGAIIGFMTLQADGYIDFAYVAPDHIGQGIAKQLYDRTTAEARETGVQRLYSEASYPARRFFERQGWSVVKEQTATRRDVSMTNFLMEKYLTE